MNDIESIERVETAYHKLIMSGIYPDAVLSGIGFDSIVELGQAYKNKTIGLGANYNAKVWDFLASKGEKRLDWCLAVTPWLMALVGFTLAYTQGKRIYVAGALGVLMASSLAKRYAELGNAIAGLGLMASLGGAFAGNWIIFGTIISLVISAFCARLQIGYYSEVIVNRSLESSALFAFLFVNDKVNVRNNSTGKKIYYEG